MVVVHEVHAAWKSAHTLCNVCAGFHVMYIHEIGEEKNYRYQASFVCVRFSKEEGVGEKRLVFVSKNISVFTDDPKEGNCQMPRYKFEVNTQCFFFVQHINCEVWAFTLDFMPLQYEISMATVSTCTYTIQSILYKPA